MQKPDEEVSLTHPRFVMFCYYYVFYVVELCHLVVKLFIFLIKRCK